MPRASALSLWRRPRTRCAAASSCACWRPAPARGQASRSASAKRNAPACASPQPVYTHTMPAYVIIETDVHDAGQYAHYEAAAPGTIAGGGGGYIVRGGELAVLEGDWRPKRMVVLEFPDLNA